MTLHTVELPRYDWARALEQFSIVHDGWLVSSDVLGAAIGAQPELVDLPLVGISFEPAHDGTVIVTAGRSATGHITHTIRAPRHIWIERNDVGADVALTVEAGDRTQTIVRLKTAALPETVDGLPRARGTTAT